MRIFLLSVLSVALLFSCKSDAGKEEMPIVSDVKDSAAAWPNYTLDDFSGRCWECYQERIDSDSLIQHFITYYNNEPFKPSSGYGHIGCQHYVPKSAEEYYKAVEILMHAIYDTTLGTGVRSGLMKDLTGLTAYRIKYQDENHTFPDLTDDSVETFLLDQWDRWWLQNRNRSAIDWSIDALKNSYPKYSRSVAIGNLEEIGDSAKAADPLFKALDTVDFEYHGNLNSQIIPVLAQFKERRIIPFIIRYHLQDDFKYRRENGVKYLREVTGKTLGYSATSPYVQRKAAITRWWDYWDSEKEKVPVQ